MRSRTCSITVFCRKHLVFSGNVFRNMQRPRTSCATPHGSLFLFVQTLQHKYQEHLASTAAANDSRPILAIAPLIKVPTRDSRFQTAHSPAMRHAKFAQSQGARSFRKATMPVANEAIAGKASGEWEERERESGWPHC